jgi:hypothetical protein
MADQFTRRTMQAVLGLTVVYTTYPAIGAGVIIGTVSLGGAGVWGADIAMFTIATESWFVGCDVDTVTVLTDHVVDFEEGGVTHLWSFRLGTTAVDPNVSRIMCGQFPKYITAGAAVTARVAATGATAISLSPCVATGL